MVISPPLRERFPLLSEGERRISNIIGPLRRRSWRRILTLLAEEKGSFLTRDLEMIIYLDDSRFPLSILLPRGTWSAIS